MKRPETISETPLEFMMSQVFGLEVSEEQMLKPKEQTKPKRPKQDIVIYKRSEKRVPRDGKDKRK